VRPPPQALWRIAKSLLKRDGPQAPTAIHGSSGLKSHPLEKANAIADYLENLFTPHDLCDENHERRVEARVQALLEAVGDSPQERVRPCDVQNILKTLKLKKACGIDGIPNECLRHLKGGHWHTLRIYLTIASGYHIFLCLGRKQNLRPNRNLVRTPNFLKIYVR
jgi:hypothetical protein